MNGSGDGSGDGSETRLGTAHGNVARFVASGPAPDAFVGAIDEWNPSLNLLGHAQLIELDIGSRCGGHGICGADRVRIERETQKNFFSAPTEREFALLTPVEIAAGWRLGCQCFPNFRRMDEVASGTPGMADGGPTEIRIELPAHRS